ncbi:MAG: sec-independent protein translocase protein TatC [Actinomycetota bacterium]|jgi:sec-independent protein translocase protein TatC|nr:sec-independent protein translocase protein TatC [Actinomycetota bacterium]
MSPVLRRGARTPRPTDGAMTLVEHLYELRNRLFKASLGIVAGMVFALFFATEILDFLSRPYRQALQPLGEAGKKLIVLGPTDFLILQLKVGLYAGLLISAPIWLYQLWSFITPGLHRHERRWAYAFVAVATPLFAAGALLAYLVVAKGLEFLLPGAGSSVEATLELTRYIDFVTSMMLLFGIGLEFPLVVMMLNLVGLVSARRLLSWWRVAVFLMFLFAAFVTPTPDPFGMIALALPMSALYFAAVGVAFLNDRRRARAALVAGVAALSDDETSPLDERLEEVEPAAPLDSGHDPDRRHDPDDRP